MNWLY